jgi:hypothetical protein
MARKITIIIEDDGQQPVEQIINPLIYPTIPGPSWVPWIPTPLPQQLPGDGTSAPGWPSWQPYIICAVPN